MNAATHTLIGVTLGAMLATLGGFLATQMNAAIERRRRARAAALLFGELLATINVLLRLVEAEPPPRRSARFAHLGLLRALQRETEIYNRNREHLFEIPDAMLRARLHRFMVRLSVPLERIIEARTDHLSGRDRELDENETSSPLLETGAMFTFLVQRHTDIPELLEMLARYARAGFEAYTHEEEQLFGEETAEHRPSKSA